MLFIDRLPLHWWMPDSGTGGLKFWSVSVPALATEADASTPPAAKHWQRWRIDTGCTGETYVWRSHLIEAGLDPRRRIVRSIRAVLGSGTLREDLLIRAGHVWLFSNIPALRDEPFRLRLHPGITFINRDYHGDPRLATPVIGMQALRRAGVKVEINCATDTLSVWVPCTWMRRLSVTAKRFLTGGRRISMPWRD